MRASGIAAAAIAILVAFGGNAAADLPDQRSEERTLQQGLECRSLQRSVQGVIATEGYGSARLAAIFDDALTDNGPLKNLLAQVVDQRVIDGIAAEYAKGRILLVGTTNLDAGRAVIWNLGEIAASGHPRAAELIRLIR